MSFVILPPALCLGLAAVFLDLVASKELRFLRLAAPGRTQGIPVYLGSEFCGRNEKSAEVGAVDRLRFPCFCPT